MKEVLEPLTMIAGLRLAALISDDGVPIAMTSGNGSEEWNTPEAMEEFQAFSAIAAGWMGDVNRAVAPLSWSRPQRLVLSGTRGAVALCAGPGALLIVALEHGVSPEDLKVPMEGVVARMQRKLRNMGSDGGAQGQAAEPVGNVEPAPEAPVSDPMDPQGLAPIRELPQVPQPPQSPSPQ